MHEEPFEWSTDFLSGSATPMRGKARKKVGGFFDSDPSSIRLDFS